MNTNTNPDSNVYPTADPQGSTGVPTSAAQSSPLQRGKACLPCRRRKMKCDGSRPICTPCLRGERAEDCEYTDGQRRPLTLTLEDEIARLRTRVQELENPERAIPPVELHPPYAGADAGAAGSSSAASASASVGHSRLPVPGSSHPSRTRQTLSQEPPSDFEADVHFHSRRALSVVAPYSAELGVFLNLDRLRVQGTHVLPALQSALTLWCVYITIPPVSDHSPTHERTVSLASFLLSQAQAQFASALGTIDAEPDPAMFLHVIQTGVLLALYMHRIGKVVGARYHSGGTWALVMFLYRNRHLPGGAREGEALAPRGSGVRERSAHVSTSTDANTRTFAFAGGASLAPALDRIEAEERIRAFWAVYALDRWFGALCQVPFQSFGMDGNAETVMPVPWPSSGIGGPVEARPNAIQQFLSDPNHDFALGGASAMHAKASVLLGEAVGIAASFVADHTISQSTAFRARFGTLDALLQRCLSAATTMAAVSHGRPPQTQEQTHALVTIHLIALAHIALHRPFISTYGPSRRRSVEGAMGVVQVLDQLGEAGWRVGRISPVYATVWTASCLALRDEFLRLRARPDADPSRRREEGELVGAIRRLVGALSALSQCCPSRFTAANIEAVLPVLESITI